MNTILKEFRQVSLVIIHHKNVPPYSQKSVNPLNYSLSALSKGKNENRNPHSHIITFLETGTITNCTFR